MQDYDICGNSWGDGDSWTLTSSGCVLVRNHYSLISAGTEGSTVKAARKSLLGKAKERPQQVKQVLDVF